MAFEFRNLLKFAGLVALTTSIFGCSGGDTGGGSANDADEEDGVFVDTDDAAGGLRIRLNEEVISVADIAGFFVQVFDAQGNGVPNIQVSCDTEEGLALIEPSTGREFTDSSGNMSGKLGCELPGSYQMACRTAVPGGKRIFADVICEGPIPVGFDGFPGAGGGGLGGGSGGVGGDDDAGPGGTDPNGVRIVSIAAFDEGDIDSSFAGGEGDLSIDVNQDDCDDDPAVIEAELFFDTIVGFDVENNTNQSINFTSFNYTVRDADGAGTTFTSDTLALTNADEVGGSAGDAAGQKRFLGLFLDAQGGFKYFNGSAAPIPSNLGFRNVQFRLFGTSSQGDSVTLTKTLAFSFGNFDRCGD